MKTLIYTSIYSNLFGTEFGGRPGRETHYKLSLYNILNLKANDYICFTSQEELGELENFFYVEKSIDPSKLKFVVFDLHKSPYFEEIRRLKNMEEIINYDRCFEIQYNKFFWLDLIENIQEYDRVYWFDAGLSHVALFPEEYSYGEGIEFYYFFNLFTEKFLNSLNELTNSSIVLIGRRDGGEGTIPETYYNEYEREYHIVGGFFGGTPERMFEFKSLFEPLLKTLLEKEPTLYHEELLMSSIYHNNKDKFNILSFYQWNYYLERENESTFFYDIFRNMA